MGTHKKVYLCIYIYSMRLGLRKYICFKFSLFVYDLL